jgi:hypothetical protein
MKCVKITGGLVLTLAVLVSTALAGGKRAPMLLTSAAQINGKQLPAGNYELKWEGTGTDVRVQFLHGKKVVATAPAKLEQVTAKATEDSALIDNASGTRQLTEARFAGKNYKLVFAGAEAQAQNTQTSGSSGQTNR